jgi:hypothetical protein
MCGRAVSPTWLTAMQHCEWPGDWLEVRCTRGRPYSIGDWCVNECGASVWNGMDKVKPTYSEKSLAQRYYVGHNSNIEGVGWNPGLCTDISANNCLRYGTVWTACQEGRWSTELVKQISVNWRELWVKLTDFALPKAGSAWNYRCPLRSAGGRFTLTSNDRSNY